MYNLYVIMGKKKRNKAIRITSLVVVFLLVLQLLPLDMFKTVSYAKTVTKSIDLSGGLTAGEVYGDKETIKVEVLEDMTVKASEATIDDEAYTAYVQGSNNAKDTAGSTCKGSIPATGAAFKITAIKNSKVTFVTKDAPKVWYFVKEGASEPEEQGTSIPKGATSFDVTAGNTYFYYASGSKVCVYDIQYTVEEAEYKKAEVDLTAGLVTTGTYGDAEIADITVLEDMGYKASETEISGVNYAGYVQGKNNAKDADSNTCKGSIPATGAAFKIVAKDNARITFVIKETGTKYYYFVDSENPLTEADGKTLANNGALKFDIEKGKTYYFYVSGSKVSVFGITLEVGEKEVDWASVAAPVLGTPTQDNGKITVPYTANIGDDGAELIKINMYKAGESKAVDYRIGKAPGTSGSLEFEPTDSGDYKFKAVISREGKEDKESNEVALDDFSLPLSKPVIVSATSKGDGKIEVEWNSVKEAESYVLEYTEDGKKFGVKENVTSPCTIEGFTVGKEYSFTVKAVRGSDTSEYSDAFKATATQEAQRTWKFARYGQGIDIDKEGPTATGSVNTNDLKISAMAPGSGAGKIVPANTDGLAFYYTTISNSVNFKCSGTVIVDKWALSNGQEGFGLMASDRVGTDGNGSAFWTNSYMAMVSKVEYCYDTENEKVSNVGDKITMKCGILSQEKVNVTKDNLAYFEDPATVGDYTNNTYSTTMYPLETSCAQYGAGTYNIIGNYDESAAQSFVDSCKDDITELKFTIERNNTGYFVTYTDKDGVSNTKKYYDRDALSKIDEDNIYVGFFASRNAIIDVKDVQVTESNPATDAPAEERPLEQVEPNYQVISSTTAATPDYTFTFLANADGKLVVKDSSDNVLFTDEEVKADVKVNKDIELVKGKNNFKVEFTPNADYKPDEFSELSSYDMAQIDFTVDYKNYGKEGESIYVTPDGSSSGTGSKEKPLDIYTAVKYAAPGQTILLAGGVYNLTSPVVIPRGIDGTADKMINMVADPDDNERPVLDFGKVSAGFTAAGNYWRFKGFDVTNTVNALRGFLLSGSNNIADDINTYHNGNSGFQVSRFLTSDEKELWPANNYILNCTSYGNADAGYEDADGFAAKLTIGEGNVFEGCIAHHNADDGWDLFAKVETGQIGKVVIKNCIAYANGFLEDGTNAGNGNGFKLGGASIPGKHELINSIAYDNKAKGIDSNSCPDIIVKNCTSYNNGSYNVALYTNDAPNTEFKADGVLSYRKANTDVGEQYKPKGTQNDADVYKLTNYFWMKDLQKSISPAQGADPNKFVADDWFVSLDTTVAPTRFEDGSINMHGLLELTDKADPNSGARLYSTPSITIDIPPVLTGDSSMIMLYVALLALSVLALGVVVFRKRRHI